MLIAAASTKKIVFHIESDPETMTIAEHKNHQDWKKWKEVIENELNTFNMRKVFGSVVKTPHDVIPIEHKWEFIRKRNEHNEMVRYKMRLVAQGFT